MNKMWLLLDGNGNASKLNIEPSAFDKDALRAKYDLSRHEDFARDMFEHQNRLVS
jgi:hypothetical protein